MKKTSKLLMILGLAFCLTSCTFEVKPSNKKLHEYYADYFPIGAAFNNVNVDIYNETLAYEFNSLTCENEMKWVNLQPNKGVYQFDEADMMVKYAKDHNMVIRGHALVWHNKAASPSYIFRDENDNLVSKEELKATMKDHIRTVISHFGDDVYCWDVVNEAITDDIDQPKDDRSNIYTKCDWYSILGEEYVLLAFKYAKEIIDELGLNIKLFYNDYEMANPLKRQKTLMMLEYLLENDCPIDGIGMQSHYHMSSFSMDEFEKSIIEFSKLGLEVQITEFDVNIYDRNKSYTSYYDFELPQVAEEMQAAIYDRAFEIMRKHKDVITGVTFWGIADDMTYMDNDPNTFSAGHKNYPYVFDTEHNKKLAYEAITNF